MRGYRILEQNWHRSRQHIDIIAKKEETIYMVSVIYASSTDQKNARVTALTESELAQLKAAEETWVIEEKFIGPTKLASVEVSDPNFAVISFSDSIA